MHYKNGKEAKVGDLVVGTDYNGLPVAGVVVKQLSGSDTCNLYVVPVTPHAQVTLTAKECVLHADAMSVQACEASSQQKQSGV